jgi:L-lactate dehydrogenase complex protein LldG
MSASDSALARSMILGRIRDALGERRSAAHADHASIARTYRQAADLDPAARTALFVDRLEHYQVGAYRATRSTLPAIVGQTLALRSRTSLLVPSGVPRDWLPSGLRVIADDGLGHAELDRIEGVLTGCSVAIAATGTIVLRHVAAEGRRALTLVPDYHLCVVMEDQIVQTVPEAIRVIESLGPSLVTTISGPSATADIEMTRIRGVHGPRTLDVVIVG